MTRCPNCGAGVGKVYEMMPTSPPSVQNVCAAWCGWTGAKASMTQDELAALDRQAQQEALSAERSRASRRQTKATDGWSDEFLTRARR